MLHPRRPLRLPIRPRVLVSEQPSQPTEGAAPAGSAEHDVAGRAGEKVGRFAMLAMRRLEQTASAAAMKVEQTMARQMGAAERAAAQTTDVPAATDHRDADALGSNIANARAPASTTARAEAIVDGASAQLGFLGTLVRHQFRRAAALAREEAEDIWAEAQQIRAAQRRDRD